jgi:lipoprotein
MKKYILIGMMSALVLTSACAAKKNEPETSAVTPSTEVSESEKIKDETIAGAPNPYTDVKTFEEAEKVAGFGIQAPDNVEGYPSRRIQVIKDSQIEVIYQGEEQEIMIRKAVGEGKAVLKNDGSDPSQSEVTIDNNIVSIQGEGELIKFAGWEKDGYTYTIYTNGIGLEEITAIIEATK